MIIYDRTVERERRYGMEAGDYQWLADMTDGRCWVCKQPETVANRQLAIDHDHRTGAVRGLLCTRCNQVLGRMHDDPALLRAAAEYLDNAYSAFMDGCEKCLPIAATADEWMVAPAVIVSTDGQWTTFGYQCKAGHRWTCGWRTRGTPATWSI